MLRNVSIKLLFSVPDVARQPTLWAARLLSPAAAEPEGVPTPEEVLGGHRR